MVLSTQRVARIAYDVRQRGHKMNAKRALQLAGRLAVLIVLGMAVLGLVLLANLSRDLVAGFEPQAPAQATPPPPFPFPTPIGGFPIPETLSSFPTPAPRPTLTLEEEDRVRERERQELLTKGAVITNVSGPETAGTSIEIADKIVQLPPDAYVEARWDEVWPCIPHPRGCMSGPFYDIRRGNSSIEVYIPFGVVVDQQIAPGEEEAFDFLKPVLSQ